MKEASDTKQSKSNQVKPIRSKDLTGAVYGEYTVLEFKGVNKNKSQLWRCVCSCGEIRVVQKANLIFSKHPSCGCLKKKNICNLTGDRFNNFLVLGFSHKDKHNQSHWLCKCKCGVTKTVNGPALISNHTKSCGNCIPRTGPLRHGDTIHKKTTPEYRAWLALKSRTSNINDADYLSYGGRGITVCDRWSNSFENFLLDMGRKPKNTSVDRIDNLKGYFPGNCRWATASQQSRNRRNNFRIELNGESRILIEWSEITGIKPCTIKSRLNRGWSSNRALNTPARKKL